MLLNNTLFDVDNILAELKKKSPHGRSSIEVVQQKLKKHYFSESGDNDEILTLLKQASFNAFPRLQYVLKEIFSGNIHIEIPAKLQDWQPTLRFAVINQKYGYFQDDLSSLFQELAIACRKITTLVEHQAYDDEMAYKLMALFYDPCQSQAKNVEIISKKFDKLINTKKDKSINTPFHDAFVTDLHHFPKFSDIKKIIIKDEDVSSFPRWQQFIAQEGFKALFIFSQCATECDGFKSIDEAKEFLLTKTYPRANEHRALATLCKRLLISNDGFEAGLAEVQSGWPKKDSDNIPIVDIADDSGRYFWVKLPPQDMRAMYLGNLIPSCCQFIDGNSQQCVKDGIRLSDNGFYVLLKAKKTSSSEPRLIDNAINDKDYDVVAQSYAWKSDNGNLCLDSIEWHQQRVTVSVIQDLMTKFSAQVFEEYPEIKHVTVGSGGQTPKNIFKPCSIHETMKQGEMYGDSQEQYSIASNINHTALEVLKNRLKNKYPVEFQDTVLYLAPYFDNIENFPESLIRINPSIEDSLPKFVQRINLPQSLSVDDFKSISFDEYQQMTTVEQAKISTVCKLVNSNNEETLMQWLPTIKDEELSSISLKYSDYSTEFIMSVFKQLPEIQRLKVVLQKNSEGISLLWRRDLNLESLRMILDLIPIEQRLAVVKEKNEFGGYMLWYGAENSELLRIILERLAPEQIFDALKEIYHYCGLSVASFAASRPTESLKGIIEFLSPKERLELATGKKQGGVSILWDAVNNTESLRMILGLIPIEERLKALSKKNKDGKTILRLLADSQLNIVLELLPEEAQLVFKSRADELKTHIDEIIECALSIENFVQNMQGLASPQAIKAFVHAIIQNQDIKSAQDALFEIKPSFSMFNHNNHASIEENIKQLHPYWLHHFQLEPQSHHP